MLSHYDLSAYKFDIPEHLIAQYPHDPADQCKLMQIDVTTGSIRDTVFDQALAGLGSDSVLFFNNSKVLKARIAVDIGGKSGELFFVRYLGNQISEFMVRPGKKCKIGTIIQLGDYSAKIIDMTSHGRLIHIDGDIYQILEQFGQMPLPPYISYQADKVASYQPVFAQKPGSVASPTASLHFTPRLLDQLKQQGVQMSYVTLHVGLGTFQGVNVEDITQFDIHPETVEIRVGLLEEIASYHLTGKKIIGVGTTVCRTLETLPYMYKICQSKLAPLLTQQAQSYRNHLSSRCQDDTHYCLNPLLSEHRMSFQTKLYITPGFETMILQDLITNFHLSGSSLLILVASLMGYNLMIQAYQHAIAQDYQFYSFGDAMWIQRPLSVQKTSDISHIQIQEL